MLQIKSFFILFPLSNSSINTKHHSQPQTRNPSQRTNPYFAKFSQELSIFEFYIPVTFSHQKPLLCLQEVSLSKYTPLPWVKTSRIEPYTCIHIQLFLDFAYYYSVCFN